MPRPPIAPRASLVATRRPPGPPRRRIVGPCATISILALSLACGQKGDPLPPQSFAPVVTRDLTLSQQGQVLSFDLTYPQSTSAGTVLPGLEAVEVWDFVLPPGADPASIDAAMFERTANLMTRVHGPELSSGITGNRLRVRIALEDARTDDQTHLLAIRTVSTGGDTSSLSNLVALRLAAAPAAPTDVTLEPRSNGVEVSWSWERETTAEESETIEGFHVYRKGANQRTYGEPVLRAPAEQTAAIDTDAAFGERYFYTVRAVASLEPLVESDAASEVELDYRDVFAPPPPVGLTALAEGERVRLLIDPSPADDVAGYVVFRREPRATEFRRLNQRPIPQLEYVDTGLAAGLTYSYRVSAVDTSGNQGEPGETIEVTVR